MIHGHNSTELKLQQKRHSFVQQQLEGYRLICECHLGNYGSTETTQYYPT